MRKHIAAAVFLICAGITPVRAESTEISSIDIDCNVLDSGDAEITEQWDMDVNEGTEVYKSLYSMHEKDVTLESVTDESGRKYTNIGSWNTSASKSQKKYKCGINDASDGKEICMGIDSYGHKTYTMKYRVSRFVNQYKDTQGINYTFFSNMSIPASRAAIRVRNRSFTKNTKVWSFGYKGDVYPHDGYIEMRSSESPERMQLLAETGGRFADTDGTNSDMTFSQIRKDAFKGSSYKEKGRNLFVRLFFAILFSWSVFYTFIKPRLARRERPKYGILSADGISIPYSEVHPFRDVPNAKPDEYEFAAVYSDMKSSISSAISGYLMSWYMQDAVDFSDDESGRVRRISFLKTPENMGAGEADIFRMFKSAGSSITTDEFQKYCRWHSNQVSTAIKKAEKDAGRSVRASFKSGSIAKIPVYDENYFEKAQQIYGLYKFLDDEDNMKDKRYIEVSLWEGYLVAASFFGIAKKVEKQLRELVPDMPENLESSVSAMYCFNTFASAGADAVAEARRSSGHGGSSSVGGFPQEAEAEA